MNKIWLMAWSTYRRRIRSGMFLILTFGLPLVMLIAGAVPLIRNSGDLPPVGIVDQTGQLAPVSQVSVGDQVLTLTPYASLQEAGDAIQQGDIAGYLVVPENYFQGEATTFYGEDPPTESLKEGLTIFMQHALLPDAPPAHIERLYEPAERTFVAQSSGEEVSEGPGLIIQILTPVILAMVFALAVFTGANQMGSIVVREKEQRAMEMIITSMSPRQLVMGKILGITLLSLTQVGIWTLGALSAAALALSNANTGGLAAIHIPWRPIIWSLLMGIPGYFLYATLGSGLGIIAGDAQQARQLSGYLGLLGLFPLYFTAMIVEAPNGALAVGLTLFPLTAPMMSLLRMTMTAVPAWQLMASLAILLACLVAAIWFVARIFRIAMLMYGQTLNPKQLLDAVKASRVPDLEKGVSECAT